VHALAVWPAAVHGLGDPGDGRDVGGSAVQPDLAGDSTHGRLQWFVVGTRSGQGNGQYAQALGAIGSCAEKVALATLSAHDRRSRMVR
jgi:hypothetical protein